MKSEEEFFAELHPQVVEVLGTAVMQVLVEQREPSREALIEMIQVLWQEEDVDLAVELAIDVLRLPKSRAKKTRRNGRALINSSC